MHIETKLFISFPKIKKSVEIGKEMEEVQIWLCKVELKCETTACCCQRGHRGLFLILVLSTTVPIFAMSATKII